MQKKQKELDGNSVDKNGTVMKQKTINFDVCNKDIFWLGKNKFDEAGLLLLQE